MKILLSVLALVALMEVSAAAAETKIVAAENFYGGIAQLIAGNDADVSSILSNPNQDPHEFTTSAGTAKSVADADIVIYSGIGYDAWMDKLLATQGKPGRVAINVSALVGARDGDNPHIWYDPRTMPALADKLAAELAARFTEKGGFFRLNADNFRTSMKPVVDEIARIKARDNGTIVTATEPVFGYMSDALGFKMLNYDFQLNIMNDTEPSAAQTAAFEKSLGPKTVKLLFYNKQVTDPTTERLKGLATQAGIPIIGVTETQPPESKSYVAWILTELREVKAGLITAGEGAGKVSP
jgi:zinc/manganese transport system substrate-binding protein